MNFVDRPGRLAGWLAGSVYFKWGSWSADPPIPRSRRRRHPRSLEPCRPGWLAGWVVGNAYLDLFDGVLVGGSIIVVGDRHSRHGRSLDLLNPSDRLIGWTWATLGGLDGMIGR